METSSSFDDSPIAADEQRAVAHPDGTVSAALPTDDWPLDPATTAVIVADVQRLFTDLLGVPVVPPLAEVLQRIESFIEQARTAGAQIILVRTVIAPEDHSRSTLQWPAFMRANVA